MFLFVKKCFFWHFYCGQLQISGARVNSEHNLEWRYFLILFIYSRLFRENNCNLVEKNMETGCDLIKTIDDDQEVPDFSEPSDEEEDVRT